MRCMNRDTRLRNVPLSDLSLNDGLGAIAFSRNPSTGANPEPSAEGCTATPCKSLLMIGLSELQVLQQHTAYRSACDDDQDPRLGVGLIALDNGRETHGV